MNPFEHISMIATQRHAELLKEAEQNRLLNEAFKDKTPKTSRIALFLASVGKELEALGYSLETRFGAQVEPRTTLRTQTNPGGCT
jgi:hypothetical protein